MGKSLVRAFPEPLFLLSSVVFPRLVRVTRGRPVRPPEFRSLARMVTAVVRVSIGLLSAVNDRDLSSNRFKQKREFIGMCKQNWCPAGRAGVPKTGAPFAFWSCSPRKWGRSPAAALDAGSVSSCPPVPRERRNSCPGTGSRWLRTESRVHPRRRSLLTSQAGVT